MAKISNDSLTITPGHIICFLLGFIASNILAQKRLYSVGKNVPHEKDYIEVAGGRISTKRDPLPKHYESVDAYMKHYGFGKYGKNQ